MNDKQLLRSLRSIGMKCFVKYFEEFSNERISIEDLVDVLVREEGYAEAGSKTRVRQSRRIIQSGRAQDALLVVVGAKRIEDGIRGRANELLGGT